MDAELDGLVASIERAAALRAQAEFDVAHFHWTLRSGHNTRMGVWEAPPTLSQFQSDVDIAAAFVQFVNLPEPDTCDDAIATMYSARHDLASAYNQLIGLLRVRWDGRAGDGFHNFAERTWAAASEHLALLEGLETIYRTYRELLKQTRAAARILAQQILDSIRDIGSVSTIDWAALADLAVVVAESIATALSPPIVAARRFLIAAHLVGFAAAGSQVLASATVGAPTIRGLMPTAATAAATLLAGVQEKAAVLAAALNEVPGVIADNAQFAMPVAPTAPSELVPAR